MNRIIFIVLISIFLTLAGSCRSQDGSYRSDAVPGQNPAIDMKLNELNEFEKYVILQKGTERPFTGEYTDHFEKGTYHCKQCGAALYVSESKFHSECGWPSFDDEIEGAVKRTPDTDGLRTEITCAQCDGHLGHVFTGEGLTDKNTRHCVNSVSMTFVPKANDSAIAIFAGGCFWGVEHYFQNETGVLSTRVGYTGGTLANPTYEEVCKGKTGHYEAIEVTYDPDKTDYETLTRLFFEIHDPTQADGQGNDIGLQYQSVIFYGNAEEKVVCEKLIQILNDAGFKVVTQLKPSETFWPAESYHQRYYSKKGGSPYCHFRVKRFPDK